MENEFYRDYKERVMPALQKQHQYKNVHQVPKVEKVVINTSVGSQSDVKQALEEAKAELALITGQRPMETLAKKSISNFKLRKIRPSERRSRCGASACTNSLSASSRLPCRAFVISAACRPGVSTTTAITRSAFRPSRSSPNSNSTKSSASSDSTLQQSPRRQRTKKLDRY